VKKKLEKYQCKMSVISLGPAPGGQGFGTKVISHGGNRCSSAVAFGLISIQITCCKSVLLSVRFLQHDKQG